MLSKILLSFWLPSLFLLTVAIGQNTDRPRLVVQTGHSARSAISSIVFSKDGRSLASSSGATIEVWDVDTGRVLRTFTADSRVNALALNGSGRILASTYTDKIKLWDVTNGRELRTLTGPDARADFLLISNSDQLLVTGGEDKSIRIWEVANGRILRTLKGHSKGIESLAVSPDDKILVSGSQDASIRLWDVMTGREMRTLKGHTKQIKSLAFSPDGSIVASGSNDQTIKLWEAATGRLLRTLTHPGVDSLAFSADGKSLVSGSEDIKVWNVASGSELKTFAGSSRGALSYDGRTLAIRNWNKIELVELPTGREMRVLGHSKWVKSVLFSDDGQTLISSSYDEMIRIWQLSTGAVRLLSNDGEVSSIALSADGKVLASGTGGTVKLWELATGRELRILVGHLPSVRSLALSRDGTILVAGTNKGHGFDKTITIKVWDVGTGQVLRAFVVSTKSLRGLGSIALSSNGRILAASIDNEVVLWDVNTSQQLHTFVGHSKEVTSVTFNLEGTMLATGSLDTTIKLWDVTTGRELRKLVGHGGWVNSVKFNDDGKSLISGSDDGTVRQWDVVNGSLLRTFAGHSYEVTSVAFGGSGKFIASGSTDGMIRLWRSDNAEVIADLYSLDRKNWAVTTPSGLFDASPGARNWMHYVVGAEIIMLDQMKDLYFLPGLLQKVMQGDELPHVKLFGTEDLFPVAEYKQLERAKTFTLKLHNRGGGIGPVQVIVNGTEVISDARPTGFDPDSREATLTVDLSNVKQFFPGEENRVEVITWNKTASLNSKNSPRGIQLVFVGEGNALTTAPEFYAIIGGVSRYVQRDLDLRYSSKDAEDFARAVQIGAAKFLGRDKVHIWLLTSEEAQGQEHFVSDVERLSPSKENFRKVFAEVAAKAQHNDILLVYLSGHGLAFKQKAGDLYLYLSKEAYTTDDLVLAQDKVRAATAVSSEELVQWIREISASKKALVLDTCASGAAADSLIAKKEVPPEQLRALERLKDRTGFFVLMGSAADRVSYETSTYRQGLLTYSLLEALKGARLHEGYANVGQLFDYAQDRVPQLARNIGAIQQPRFLVPESGSSFDIGFYTTDEQRLFSLPSPQPLILRPSLQNQDLGYDNLNLQPLFRLALRDASYVSTNGDQRASVGFVDASEMADAFLPVGSYIVSEGDVTVKLNLMRNDKLVATLMIRGLIADKTELVRNIVKAVIAKTSTSNH